MRFVIYSSKMTSLGAKSLAKALNAVRVFPNGGYVPKPDDIVINWGNSRVPIWNAPMVWNNWDSVKNAIRKDNTFIYLAENNIRTVPWTQERIFAKDWLLNKEIVFARQQLAASQGQGIVVMHKPEDLVNAPLYTLYVPGCDEYRIHVAFDKIINFQQKKKKNGANADKYIRSYEKGWIFARQEVVAPNETRLAARKAIRALGLHFGAVDILYNPQTGKEYILEVNTAPGLDSQNSIDSYANAFKDYAQEKYV